MERGELQKRAHQTKGLNEVFELTESGDFTLADIQVITLKQWATEQAHEEAWMMCNSPSEVETLAQQIFKTKYSTVSEFVSITEDCIQIGINAAIITDKVVDRALAFLFEVGDFTVGKYVEIGQKVALNDS